MQACDEAASLTDTQTHTHAHTRTDTNMHTYRHADKNASAGSGTSAGACASANLVFRVCCLGSPAFEQVGRLIYVQVYLLYKLSSTYMYC